MMGISREQIQAATALGGGAGTIAARLGLTVNQLRSAWRQHRMPLKLMTRDEIAAAAPLDWLQAGLKSKTVSQLAQERGLPENTLRAHIERLGLAVDPAVVNEARRLGAIKAAAKAHRGPRGPYSKSGDAIDDDMPAIDLEAPGDPMGKLLAGAAFSDNMRAAARRNDFMRGQPPVQVGAPCSSLVRE